MRTKEAEVRIESQAFDAAAHTAVTPAMDRRNGSIFLVSWLLIYLAAPVIYIDVVQATLCNKLGAGPTVANLPASAYFFGSFSPFFFSWLVPHRLVRTVTVVAYATTASLLGLVCALLVLPVPDSVRIAAVIGQGLVQGFTASISFIYMWQCLKRGTTLEGRARALKLTYGLGPLAAVAGSLGAQFVLNQGIPGLGYPYDFAALYLVGVLCLIVVALSASRYELTPIEEEERKPFLRYLADGVRGYVSIRTLVVLWIAYLFWYVSLSGMPNLSLYTRDAVGRDPKELAGWILALRFGFKALAGFALGAIAMRFGIRAPLVTTVSLLGAAAVWAWIAPGYAYLFSFGLMGMGELGGAYFPNYVVAFSSPAAGAMNLSLLHLVTSASSFAPVLHGALTEWFGFRASFTLGAIAALVALLLVFRLPTGPIPGSERKK
jgi:MFS family permease